MATQLWALAAAGAVVLVAAGLELWRSRSARAHALGLNAAAAERGVEPYILYFTGDGCTVCRTHQEPALEKLGAVRIDKVDAVAERELAERFAIFTVPSTVVIGANGKAANVNYGFAGADKLRKQLAAAS